MKQLFLTLMSLMLITMNPLSISSAQAANTKTTASKNTQKSVKKAVPAKKSTAKKSSAVKSKTSKSTAKKSTASKKSSVKTTQKKSTAKKNNKKRTLATPKIAPPNPTPQATVVKTDEEMAGDLVLNALGLLGISYRYGGSNPISGLDCSGFMQYLFREAAQVSLPRTSSQMSKVGTPVERNDLRPGDLIFFRRGKLPTGHVGMYLGNDQFIHAPRTGKNIEIQKLSNAYWSKNYNGARRVHADNTKGQ